MPAVILPVKCAESGAVVNVELVNPYQDDSVAELKRLLASAAGVAVKDQILLIGPPYKPLKRLDPPLVFSSSSARDDEDLTASAAASSSDGGGGGVRGIYLYSRQTLDARAGAGLEFSGEPSSREEALRVQLPDLPSAPPEAAPAWLASASASGGSGSSRLAESLLSYERLVSLNLARGRAYVERGRRLLEACVRCLEEQRVQRDAGGVALANLLDHFGAIARDYEGLRARHAAQAGRHQALLQNFNPNLRRLDARPLLPALVEALRDSLVLQQQQSSSQQHHQHHASSSSPGDDGMASGSPGATGSMGGGSSTSSSSRHHHHLLGSASASSSIAAGSVPVGLDCAAVEKVLGGSTACTTVTLRDCVPLKRVRDWYEECSQTHERLARWVGEVGEALGQLSKGVELQRGEVRAVDWLAALAREVEGLKAQLREQEKSAATLEEAHRNALERVRGALLDSSSSSAEGMGGGAASGAKQYDTCQWLQGLLDKQAQVMDSLERVDYAMLARARALGEAKVGRTGRWLGQHLVAVSRLQGDIQALRDSLAIGDKLLREERRYFAQLEHLEKLPDAYEALLLEMARRRAYARLFELKVKGALDGVARFREGETAARAEFLRRHAAHLMPVFAQLFPTMQDRPPHFQAMALALDEEQRLPALTVEDLPGAMQLLAAGRREGEVEEEEGVAAILRGYTACLAKGREGGDGEKEEGAGGGMEIMPGMEASLSQEELEAKCAAQELAITRLAAQVQALSASRRELERQLQQSQALSLSSLSLSASGGRGGAGGGGGGGKWDGGVVGGARGLAEENDSLRSCLGAILSSVEEARRGLALPPSSTAESKAGEASSPQQIVNAVDAAVSDLVKRVRVAEAGFMKGAGIGDGQMVAGPSAGTGAGGGKPKISFREFHVGDVALFLPTSHQGENRVYLAFHMKCPHHYLSHESLESMRVRHGRFPDYILGTIVYIEELEAGEETDTRANPYHLKKGTSFKVIHATPLTDADE